MDNRTEQLAVLSDRLRAFLLDQISRLEKERNPVPTPNAAAARELEAERTRLYQEIEHERERLASEARLLVDAWKKLEEERRETLAEAEIARLAAAEPGRPSLQNSAATERPPATPPAAAAPGLPVHNGCDHLPFAAASSAHSWFEVQQLRREMQQHTACQS